MQRISSWAPVLLAGLFIFSNGCEADDLDATEELEPPTAAAEPEDETEIEESVPIGPQEAANEIAKLKQSKKGKALHEHLQGKGFEAGGKPDKDLYGKRTKLKHPDKPNVKITHTVVLQNYDKEGSTDAGALATVTITTKDQNETQTTTYDFALIAPEGNFEEPLELTATAEGTVVMANSWWSCVTGRIYSKCAGTCVASVSTCTVTAAGSWVAYLGCLGVTCGSCLTKAVGCCTCDCSWWCKWAAGCCDR